MEEIGIVKNIVSGKEEVEIEPSNACGDCVNKSICHLDQGDNKRTLLAKFDIKLKSGETKAPVVLDNAVAYLEAEVAQDIDVGTHTIFIGKVVAAEVLTDDATMTYEYYHHVKRGTTPKTAPSYIGREKGGP